MPNTLGKIKQLLDSHIGQDIQVVAQAGRKKTTTHSGKLAETFPAVFLVTLDQEEKLEQVSFSYTDILTKNIDVEFGE